MTFTFDLKASLLSPLLLASTVVAHTACTAGPGDGQEPGDGDGAPSSTGGQASTSGGATGDDDFVIDEEFGSGGSDQATSTVEIINTLPEGFAIADTDSPETSRGGFQVLGPLAEVDAPEGECANILRVIVRDFQASHDDFENAGDWNYYDVLSPIGAARKPEKTSATGPLHFEEWYQNLEGINLPFAVDLWLEPVEGTFVYDSTAFFPLEGRGYMDSYLFTTELHTNFEYQGGEVFTFRGDDDVFVYINGHLGVNLSGVHIAQEGSVNLDDQAGAFGLEIGGVYTFDLFQAERQPGGSNFRLETTLDFTGCGEILPVDVVK
jgi:fibro-slime domain-containing protein